LFGLFEEHIGPNVNDLEVDDEPSHLVQCKGVEHDFANLVHGCVHHTCPFFWFLLRDAQDVHEQFCMSCNEIDEMEMNLHAKKKPNELIWKVERTSN
jgi:hypothetical protein